LRRRDLASRRNADEDLNLAWCAQRRTIEASRFSGVRPNQALGGGTAGEKLGEGARSEASETHPLGSHSNSYSIGAGGGVAAARVLHKGESPWHSRIAEMMMKSRESLAMCC
jgi:hypothetical protein